jgi:hypothetical protein
VDGISVKNDGTIIPTSIQHYHEERICYGLANPLNLAKNKLYNTIRSLEIEDYTSDSPARGSFSVSEMQRAMRPSALNLQTVQSIQEQARIRDRQKFHHHGADGDLRTSQRKKRTALAARPREQRPPATGGQRPLHGGAVRMIKSR